MLPCRSDESSESADPPHSRNGQTMYLVFESSLLLLFSTCLHCASYTSVDKVIIGTFLRIIQTCGNCSWRRTWESQPYIGAVPAGNILTSAAILFSGALPSKALKMFQILNLSSISTKTFFRHQKNYLQPAVHAVWHRQQELVLTGLREKGNNLVLAGDGRSDSPGHSAQIWFIFNHRAHLQ